MRSRTTQLVAGLVVATVLGLALFLGLWYGLRKNRAANPTPTVLPTATARPHPTYPPYPRDQWLGFCNFLPTGAVVHVSAPVNEVTGGFWDDTAGVGMVFGSNPLKGTMCLLGRASDNLTIVQREEISATSAGTPPLTASMVQAGGMFQMLVSSYTSSALVLTSYYVAADGTFVKGSTKTVPNTKQVHDYIGGIYSPNDEFATCSAPQAKLKASTASITGYTLSNDAVIEDSSLYDYELPKPSNGVYGLDGDQHYAAVMHYTPTENQVILYPAATGLYQNTPESYVLRVSTREQPPDPLIPLNQLGLDNYAMAYYYVPEIRVVRYNAARRLIVANEQIFQEADLQMGPVQMIQMCEEVVIIQCTLGVALLAPVDDPVELKQSYHLDGMQRISLPYKVVTRFPVSIDRSRGVGTLLLPNPSKGQGAWEVYEWVLGSRTSV